MRMRIILAVSTAAQANIATPEQLNVLYAITQVDSLKLLLETNASTAAQAFTQRQSRKYVNLAALETIAPEEAITAFRAMHRSV
jgi:hypothetical protein